jgi:DNA-binding beta-propeller fold protein YncE
MSLEIKSIAIALVGLIVLTSMMIMSPGLMGDTVDPGNGGQDVCSDTERDLVYYIDPVYNKFQACGWDNNMSYEIQLGQWGVRAIDISADGSKAYVTTQGGPSIAVILTAFPALTATSHM